MTDIIEKISQYNLFNYLLPGTLFAVIIERVTSFTVMNEDIVVSAFTFYFIGLVISRIGSLAVEPLLGRLKFIKHKPYKDFIAAEKLDAKVAVLSEQNNTYRTVLAMFIILGATKGFELLSEQVPFIHEFRWPIVLVILFGLFLLAYRKQTNYIFNRIENNLNP